MLFLWVILTNLIMKIKIDFNSWLNGFIFSVVIGLPFSYLVRETIPFESGITIGILIAHSLTLLTFYFGKKYGIEIK